MVFGLVEENGFVEDGVGDSVEAPGDKTEGAEVAVCGDEAEDLDEQFVGEGDEGALRAFCGVAHRHNPGKLGKWISC